MGCPRDDPEHDPGPGPVRQGGPGTGDYTTVPFRDRIFGDSSMVSPKRPNTLVKCSPYLGEVFASALFYGVFARSTGEKIHGGDRVGPIRSPASLGAARNQWVVTYRYYCANTILVKKMLHFFDA